MNAPANKAEGWALLEMARRLERVRVSDPDSIKDAVRLNWRIWTIIQAAMLDPQTEIPITVRSNLINLTNFIDKRSVELISKPLPDKLDVLVNINRQIGAGLMGSPSDADEMEDEDEVDESDASDVSLDEGDAAVGQNTAGQSVVGQPAAGQSADGPVIYSRRGGGGGVAGQPTPNEADLSVIAPSAGPAGGAQIHASAAGSETEETESAPPASAMPIPEKNRQIADLLAAPRATDSPPDQSTAEVPEPPESREPAIPQDVAPPAPQVPPPQAAPPSPQQPSADPAQSGVIRSERAEALRALLSSRAPKKS